MLPRSHHKLAFIKELTFKSVDGSQNLVTVHGELKEALKLEK